MDTFLSVIMVILLVVAIILAVLYFFGRKMERRQVESQAAMEAAAQNVSMLVIDKKKMKLKEAGLPKIVYEQTPKYLRRTKLPIVKAKIGPKVMTLIADPKVYDQIPVKTEVKAVISGLYITSVKGTRGNALVAPPKKKGFFSRFKKDKKKESK